MAFVSANCENLFEYPWYQRRSVSRWEPSNTKGIFDNFETSAVSARGSATMLIISEYDILRQTDFSSSVKLCGLSAALKPREMPLSEMLIRSVKTIIATAKAFDFRKSSSYSSQNVDASYAGSGARS